MLRQGAAGGGKEANRKLGSIIGIREKRSTFRAVFNQENVVGPVY